MDPVIKKLLGLKAKKFSMWVHEGTRGVIKSTDCYTSVELLDIRIYFHFCTIFKKMHKINFPKLEKLMDREVVH